MVRNATPEERRCRRASCPIYQRFLFIGDDPGPTMHTSVPVSNEDAGLPKAALANHRVFKLKR